MYLVLYILHQWHIDCMLNTRIYVYSRAGLLISQVELCLSLLFFLLLGAGLCGTKLGGLTRKRCVKSLWSVQRQQHSAAFMPAAALSVARPRIPLQDLDGLLVWDGLMTLWTVRFQPNS